MRIYNRIYDIFLFEGIYIFLFSFLLLLINDRYTEIFFSISIGSIIMAGLLGFFGHAFKLFAKEDDYTEK